MMARQCLTDGGNASLHCLTQSVKAIVNTVMDALLQTVNLDDTHVAANIYICTIGWLKSLSSSSTGLVIESGMSSSRYAQ